MLRPELPENSVPGGNSTAALLSASALTAVAACAVPLDASAAPAAADPEYPSSECLEKPDIVSPCSIVMYTSCGRSAPIVRTE
ncbi:hypothetical protein PV726_38040 [Streptomyces europaeiscabiei]|uniref:hypothetical protein n=1 Tax=Streptomyces europaeiscabiei TaxID=146819 RepID=UPI0029BF27E7|nr:hypothetical protein [Streptomyces europaeiscabiei]MDX3696019.1 hypothetical protein [Streptomyces europaeiscabiei]